MAAEAGVSAASVPRIWRRHDLKPHLRRTFKLSNDSQFEEKFWDVIGLYGVDPIWWTPKLCAGGVRMSKKHPSFAAEYRQQMVELVRGVARQRSWLGSSSARPGRFATGCGKQIGTRVFARTD